MSSETLCFLYWRSAGDTCRRHSQMLARWASLWATSTSVAPCPCAASATRAISASRASSSAPSSSAITAASVPAGNRNERPSTALTATPSSSSSVRGRIPAARIAFTPLAACSVEGNTSKAVLRHRGSGSSWSVILRGHPQRALAAHEQRAEVVARHALDGPLAHPHHLAGRHHPLHPQHVVARHPVLQRPGPARVLRDVISLPTSAANKSTRSHDRYLRSDFGHE